MVTRTRPTKTVITSTNILQMFHRNLLRILPITECERSGLGTMLSAAIRHQYCFVPVVAAIHPDFVLSYCTSWHSFHVTIYPKGFVVHLEQCGNL